MKNFDLIIILGPTASGKTKLAVELANALNSEIISADSRQVYKELNIGAGKDYNDYFIENKQIKYHLIDIVTLEETYNVGRFQEDFFEIFNILKSKNIIPILCGGTGLFIESILRQNEYSQIPTHLLERLELEKLEKNKLLDIFLNIKKTDFHSIADLSTNKRIARAIEIANFLNENKNFIFKKNILPRPLIIGLNPPLAQRRYNIEMRLKERIQIGLIEEVVNLLAKGTSPEKLKFLGLEYKFVTEYILEKHSISYLEEKLLIAIQQYAKRQMTFFRKIESQNHKIYWFENYQKNNIVNEILKLLNESKNLN